MAWRRLGHTTSEGLGLPPASAQAVAVPVAFERRPTIAPMCAIGRDYQTAIGTGQGSPMGGTALTGVLTPAEADHLFRILKQLKEQGKTVILITHKLR